MSLSNNKLLKDIKKIQDFTFLPSICTLNKTFRYFFQLSRMQVIASWGCGIILDENHAIFAVNNGLKQFQNYYLTTIL